MNILKKNRVFLTILSIGIFSGFFGIPTLAAPENPTNTPTIESSAETTPSSSPSSSPSQSSSPENSTDISTSDNNAIKILKDRQTKIQKSLEKTEEEKKVEQSKKDLQTVKIEKANINEVSSEISDEVAQLQKKLDQKKRQASVLQKSLANEQQKNSDTQKKLKSLQTNITELQKGITLKNALLEKNSAEIDNLSQEEALKEYYLHQSLKNKEILEQLTSKENAGKYTLFYAVTGLFILLYGLRIFFSRKLKDSKALQKKYAHHLAAFDVLSVFFYMGFLVWFFFYVKPELVVYLLFLVGAIVMVLQEYIFSMISSVFIVQRYAVGDRILFRKKEGIIEKFSLLKVHIRDIDERGTNISELRIISNSQFMKETVSILPKSEIEPFMFKIILPNDLSINEPALVQQIEENILQKNITVKSFNELTEKEYFYDIDFQFTSTGHPVIEIFWHETREKSNRIKRKILAEIEIIKKESSSKGDKNILPYEEKPENINTVSE